MTKIGEKLHKWTLLKLRPIMMHQNHFDGHSLGKFTLFPKTPSWIDVSSNITQ